ncbi:MAG: hypothetical protein AB1918_00215 [Pseudomonadota bacterium]
MSLPRLVPAVAALFAALPAAAHEIGVGHDHAVLDGSLVVGALLAVAGLGLWYARNR